MPKLLECDCVEVCGWTKPHTLEKRMGWYACQNCGTELSDPNQLEQIISFACSIHGEVDWTR